MNIDEKIKLLRVKNDEVKQLQSVLRELNQAVYYSDRVEKAKDNEKHLFYFAVSPIFVELFKFFRLKKYTEDINNHLYDYLSLQYKKDMMIDIYNVVEKHLKVAESELDVLSSQSCT